MQDKEKKHLVIKHAQLTAAHAGGNEDVADELRSIEDKLRLSSVEIAELAVNEYLKDY